MIPSLSIKGHQNTVTAYVKRGHQLQLISLAGVRESVRAAIAAMQHHHSASLKTDQTTLVGLGYQNTQVIQGRLPNGSFHAIVMGESVTNGDTFIVKPGTSLAERLYHHLLQKSTLPLHTSWQPTILNLAQTDGSLQKLESYDLAAYTLQKPIGDLEAHIRHALIRGELPEIGDTPCA